MICGGGLERGRGKKEQEIAGELADSLESGLSAGEINTIKSFTEVATKPCVLGIWID